MTFIRGRPSADRQDRLLRALGNRQPAVHPQTASATQRRVGDAAATAASAGRVSANRVCNGNAMDVRVSSVCEVHFTGGLHPPLLRRSANVCRRNSDFCDAQTYIRPGAAGVSPPWLGNAMVDAMRLPSGNAPCAQERRASARRGWANTHRQTRASFVGRPPTVCVRIVVAIAFKATTGGLRPPLLRRSANVCRRNSDFCDAQTYIRPGAAGVSPPWCASHPRHRKLPTVGLCRPLLTQQRSPIAKKTFSNTHAFLYQERRASARRGALPIRDIGSCPRSA
jgi:hypothetical protein